MAIPNTPNYYAQQFPVFQKAMRNVLSITQAQQALITTTFDGINPGAHNYLTGLIVRLIVPDGFGMTALNQFEGSIIVINETQFIMDINTTMLDPFVVPPYQPGRHGTPAQAVPTGEISGIVYQAIKNVLPYP